jgi:hypothetical protein
VPGDHRGGRAAGRGTQIAAGRADSWAHARGLAVSVPVTVAIGLLFMSNYWAG